MTAAGLAGGQSTAPSLVTYIGLMLLFLAWGMAFVPVYRGLVGNRPRPEMNLSTPGSVPGTATLPERQPVPEVRTVPELRTVQPINRRQFLVRLGAATATVTVLGSSLGAMLAGVERRQVAENIARSMETSEMGDGSSFPNANDPVVPAPGTRLEYTPVGDHYQVFIRTEPTMIDGDTWVLPITGLVENPMTLTLDDLQSNYEPAAPRPAVLA
jgi:hypothetical protein